MACACGCRPRGPGRGGLCGLGRARCTGDRNKFAWRAGGIELENRELPGIPDGNFGTGTGGAAASQALKFGAQMVVARTVLGLDCEQRPYTVKLDGGEELAARTIVIATGAQYNKPALPNLERFEGNGVYYGATYMESQLCTGEEVAVVGGGNSAGQAATFLAQTASRVHMLVRAAELSSTMSRYLIQRLEENPKVDLHYQTEISGLDGEDHLERLTWRDRATGADLGDYAVMRDGLVGAHAESLRSPLGYESYHLLSARVGPTHSRTGLGLKNALATGDASRRATGRPLAGNVSDEETTLQRLF